MNDFCYFRKFDLAIWYSRDSASKDPQFFMFWAYCLRFWAKPKKKLHVNGVECLCVTHSLSMICVCDKWNGIPCFLPWQMTWLMTKVYWYSIWWSVAVRLCLCVWMEVWHKSHHKHYTDTHKHPRALNKAYVFRYHLFQSNRIKSYLIRLYWANKSKETTKRVRRLNGSKTTYPVTNMWK